MNLTLHLTENCNMDCDYCVREKLPRDMSEEVLDAACDLIFSSGKKAGFSFFGGEPLLKKNLIYRALDICEKKSAETGIEFKCMMTTNGILLDDEFLARARSVGMGIGLSFDGMAQNVCRHMVGGGDSFDRVEGQAKKLLKYMPTSYAICTIAPQAAMHLFESVKYIHELGFRRIICSIALGKRVNWTDEAMDIIEKELNKVADYYEECYLNDNYFFFGPINAKICDALGGVNPSDRCHLGSRQMPIAPDGNIYACTQFIGDGDYYLGNVFDGIDKEKQADMIKKALEKTEPEECIACDLRNRCTHTCGCSNRLETGNENEVSPVQCTYEKLIIGIADRVGENLYEADPEKFVKIFKPSKA